MKIQLLPVPLHPTTSKLINSSRPVKRDEAKIYGVRRLYWFSHGSCTNQCTTESKRRQKEREREWESEWEREKRAAPHPVNASFTRLFPPPPSNTGTAKHTCKDYLNGLCSPTNCFTCTSSGFFVYVCVWGGGTPLVSGTERKEGAWVQRGQQWLQFWRGGGGKEKSWWKIPSSSSRPPYLTRNPWDVPSTGAPRNFSVLGHTSPLQTRLHFHGSRLLLQLQTLLS